MTRGIATLLAVSALVLGACGGSPPAPSGSPAVTLELSAQNSKFDKTDLEVPAGAIFAIHFQNLDPLPHNLSIRGGPSPMTTEIFGGPGERTYLYYALPQGTYTFACDVHPEMKGNLISR